MRYKKQCFSCKNFKFPANNYLHVPHIHMHTHTHTHTHISQLREMLTQTISHYVSLFAVSNVAHLPQFKLQLCLESSQMEFYPSLSDLETALLSAVHTVANAMSTVPNIQVKSISLCNIHLQIFDPELSDPVIISSCSNGWQVCTLCPPSL